MFCLILLDRVGGNDQDRLILLFSVLFRIFMKNKALNLYLKFLFNIVKEVSKGVNVCFRILQSDK